MLSLKTKDEKDEKNDEKKEKHEKFEDLLDDGVEVSPVIKVIEIIGTSTESFDDATKKAIETATKSVRRVTGADVKHMTVGLKNGKIVEYRVDLKLAFALEQEDEDEEDED